MSFDEYEWKRAYEKRRKIRRRRIFWGRIKMALLTVLITSAIVCGTIFGFDLFAEKRYDKGFSPAPLGVSLSKRVKKAKNLEVPYWIDVQIIHKHSTARTGTYLNDIENIVIHYVGNPNTTAQNNRNYFDKNSTAVSSHFIVGLEGEIIQCVPIFERSAASNNRNGDTISIEVCHPDSSGKFSKTTYQSVVKLTAWLCKEFDLTEKDVIRHYDITGKACPKYYVENEGEWKSFLKDVKNEIGNTKYKNAVRSY